MAAGTTSLVAVLRDARKSALLWTRLMNSVDMIRTSETIHESVVNRVWRVWPGTFAEKTTRALEPSDIRSRPTNMLGSAGESAIEIALPPSRMTARR
jgi:hypothetical protein